jgi:hypothetical protein
VKFPADVLEGVASLLILVANFGNLAVQKDRPRRPRGSPRPPWRTVVAQDYRCRPRLTLTIWICAAVGLACWIAIGVIELT